MTNTTQTKDQAVQYIALNKLEKSPLNARKTNASIDDLLASIPEHGLMYPLGVYPGKKGKHLVFAGGRRLAALKALADDGKLEKDHPVPCQLYTEEQAAELSLVENVARVAMHPADRFEAFNALIEAGQTAEQVSVRFGVTVEQVKNSMRLARIAPKLIQEYRDEKMTYESLVAFAVVDDHEKQLAVYENLDEWDLKQPNTIRRRLTQGMVNAKDRLAVFVGLDMYQAAGGTVRTDLTGESFLENPEMLEELADKKLKLAEAELLAEGWNWVKTDKERNWEATQGCSELEPEPGDVPQELLDKQAAIEAELEAIQKEWDAADEDDDEALDAIRERDSAAEDRLDEIEEKIASFATYNPEQMQSAGCYAYIGHDGKLEVNKGLVRRQDAKKAAQHAAGDADDDQAEAKPKGISESLKRDLEAYRLGVAQHEVARHPAIAFDLLVFKAAKSVCGDDHIYDGPQVSFQRNYGGTASNDARAFVNDHLADAANALNLDWQEPETEVEQFLAFQKLTDADKDRLMAYCVASTLQPKLAPADGDEVTAYDIALAQTGANVADYWRPTKDNFLSRITKEQLLDIGRELVGGKNGDQWAMNRASSKKSALADELHKAFAEPDKHGTTAEQRERQKNWLPAGMAFGGAPQATAEAEPKTAKAKKSRKAA